MIIRNMLAAAALALAASPAMALTPGMGEVVTDTSFTTAYGQTMTIGDLKGEVVVLTFWANDCEACQEQLKTLDFYYRQRRNVGLRVLAVSADEMTDRKLKHEFKDRLVHPVTAIRGHFEPMASLPQTYFIDRRGQIRYVAEGAIGIDRLNQILVPLLRQPQP